jgi:hypothetical protein
MQMNPDSYTNSFRKRVRILFSPIRLILFIASVAFSVVGNVLYVNNGGQPEWLAYVSVIPLWACVFWEVATDMKMRRLDRENADQRS